MKNENDLILENWKSIPRLDVTFLDDGLIFTEFRNNSKKIIEVIKVSCQFQTEEWLKPIKFVSKDNFQIKPRNLKLIQIPVKFTLALKHGTNCYSISVRYKSSKFSQSKETTFKFHGMSLIIHSKRDPKQEFFESHKDPQDKTVATKLKVYLKKIGFRGFVAEEDLLPGLDLWNDKILPEIDRCKGLIVIWTKNSQQDSKRIEKEIRYAKKKRKPIISIVEGGLKIPKIISMEKNYLQTKGPITDDDLIELVANIDKTYESGGYE